jgi:predicted O-methyltransferase YrrM
MKKPTIKKKLKDPVPTRKTRFHDEKNHLVGLKNLVINGPAAALTFAALKAFNWRPSEPWISYEAIGLLKKFLTPRSRVLEFGSGMSTVWYGKHAGEVCSVDHYPEWYRKVQGILADEKGIKVRHELRENPKTYSRFMQGDKKGFDLIMVDGEWRSLCAANCLKLIRPGGIIYLDNSDKDSGPEGGDMRKAEKILLDFAKKKGAEVSYFVDFAPTQFFIQEGMLIRFKS